MPLQAHVRFPQSLDSATPVALLRGPSDGSDMMNLNSHLTGQSGANCKFITPSCGQMLQRGQKNAATHRAWPLAGSARGASAVTTVAIPPGPRLAAKPKPNTHAYTGVMRTSGDRRTASSGELLPPVQTQSLPILITSNMVKEF